MACNPSGGIKVVWMPRVALGSGPCGCTLRPARSKLRSGLRRLGEGLGVSAPRAVGNA
ncbi:hypothetical protein GQ55_9G196200 [Panicum hallii var. hallii]|uniref:Uncharacterized protein n=1 Tax=Panicum hallii var. hallii TaxID=1504633 RepID=A0A2T7C520_9POAL|nr:hypothetical protein GQ55_9G196200 [Panicum hallii var. hallii]